MKVKDLIELLAKQDPDAVVRFSVDNASQPDENERIFCESGVDGCFDMGGELTLCLVGRSNYDVTTSDQEARE